MEIRLRLGAVVFHFISERKIDVEPELYPFIELETTHDNMDILVSWSWERAEQPTGEMAGQDLLQNYYIEETGNYCVTRGGPKGAIACTYYNQEFKELQCFINEKPFLNSPHSLGHILRFLPMRAVFQHFGVSFFHASQIALKDWAILFTGPSGMGKTTQARLWVNHEGARLICNDRTLIRHTGEGWKTYGYPIDGSSPVGSGEEHTLGCIVQLSQGKENQVRKLSPLQAVSGLMPQQVIDSWNPQAHTRAMELLLEMLREIPVFQLCCTPDKNAVDCLKEELKRELGRM